VGQRVKVPEKRLRILVACGAGAAIAATFNAPITGVFFGVEIILREFSIDALFTVMLSAMVADATAGPVELYVHPNGMHQLMLSHTAAYSDVVLEWCRRQAK